jgi:hypothetical protein
LADFDPYAHIRELELIDETRRVGAQRLSERLRELEAERERITKVLWRWYRLDIEEVLAYDERIGRGGHILGD